MRAKRLYDRFEIAIAFLKNMRWTNTACAQLTAQTQAGIGDQRLGSAREQRHIRSVISHVVEFARSQPAAQTIQLSIAGEVRCAIAAHHTCEDAKILGHTLRETLIGTGGQI